MEKCIKCGVLKDEKEFLTERGKIVKTCKSCREYYKEWYARNREQIKEYYIRNKEDKKVYRRERYAQNREHYKKQKKEYNNRVAKYKTYAHQLTIEESPITGKDEDLLVRCTKCGRYFAPKIQEVRNRIDALEGKTAGEYRLYCSQTCKDSCEIYGISHDPYAKRAQFERDPQWAKEVKERAKYTCERCGSTENLEAHHEIPVKINPELVNDEDNGICLCHDCHMKAHAGDGCTLSDLRKL